MPRIFVLTVIVIYVVTTPARCYKVGKDGFNFYKGNVSYTDYLRGRTDDIIGEEVDHGDRMIYFYRTPLQLYPGLLPAFEQEYKKRNENIFKDHMINKESLQLPSKRTSKAALSLMMQSRMDPYYSDVDHYCYYGK